MSTFFQKNNKLIAKANNQSKLQDSVRLMEYINMYNLKRDQIIYACPIFKCQLNDPQFQMQVECIEQMRDIQIIYGQERKQQFSRIRSQQKKRDLSNSKTKQKTGLFGFMSKLLGSKQKPAKNQSLSASKLKMDMSNLKSSIYVNKQKKAQEQLRKSKLNNISQYKQKNQSNIKNQKEVNPFQLQPKELIKRTKSIQYIQNKSNQLQQKRESKNLFSQTQLVQINDGDLEDLLDDIEENEAKDKKQNSMPPINQEQIQSQTSRIRNSKVSRVSVQNNQNQNDASKGRMSKRSKKKYSDQENNVLDKQLTQNQFKQEPQKKQREPNMRKKKTNKLSTKMKEQKIVKKNQKLKQQQFEDKAITKQVMIQKYIQKEISRYSTIKSKDSEQYSWITANDIMVENDNNKALQIKQPIQDSFSDIKIDWMVKIEACQMQEKLLLNRIKSRWNQPLQTIAKIRNLNLSHFTPQINNDPRLTWKRANLNFGKIIE